MWGSKCGIVFVILATSGSLAAGRDALVAAELLNQAGLKSVWQVQLPINAGEKLENLYVFEGYLYAMTSRNFFFCIDRSTGSVRSMMQMATPGLPIRPPIHFENKSVFLIGQELKFFNPVTGVIERVVRLKQLSGNYGGIARNSKNVYVCGADSRLYVFNAEKGVMTFMASADNDSVIYSVIASDTTAWFGTRAGNIIAMRADSAERIWQYNLTGSMVVPPAMDGEFIYAAGLDTKMVKIRSDDGQEAWKNPFFVGDKVEKPLTIGKTCVYVYAAGSGLYAVNKDSGIAAWNLPKGYAVLAENQSLAYVYVKPGVLMVMDNALGKEQVSINIAAISLFACNMTDSSLYLANSEGQIQAAAIKGSESVSVK